MDTKDAARRVADARTILVVREPFFGALALNLKTVEVKEGEMRCDTMGVDGKHLFYCAKFVLETPDEELIGANAHEVMHCAYAHFARRGHRDPMKWNMAGDFRINYDIKEVGFKLPYRECGLQEIIDTWSGKRQANSNDRFHLYDKQFANMTTEEIYEKIPDPPAGSGATLVIDISGVGAVFDAPGSPGGNKGPKVDGEGGQGPTADELAQQWQQAVRMAVNVTRANHAGKTPGYLERLVSQLKKPKVHWKDKTAAFVDQSMSKVYSYARPNRRASSTGLIMPGLISDSLHELVFFVDCSGSISKEMFVSYASEVQGALDQGVCDHLYVVYADDGVRQVDEYFQGDSITCKTLGHGGTDFQGSFKWLRENAPEAGCCIYLTDMETCSFGEDPGIPTLWACYNTEERLNSIEPPFGYKIHIDGPH